MNMHGMNMQLMVVAGADWTVHPWRHNSSNVGGVNASQARHNSSNVGVSLRARWDKTPLYLNAVDMSLSHITPVVSINFYQAISIMLFLSRYHTLFRNNQYISIAFSITLLSNFYHAVHP